MTSDRASRPAVAGQLALELPLALPQLPLAPEWKDQQRLWGHSFHPMCSYLASFPASLAHAFIARYSRPGDVVLDPFSGRGTTPLQALAEGRIGVGNDLNPFAHLLTSAKVEPATEAEARTRLAALRVAWASEAGSWGELARRIVEAATEDPDALERLPIPPAGSRLRPEDVGPQAAGARAIGAHPASTERLPHEVALAFHADTLGQLLFVRSVLDLEARPDRFLAAATTGILHGKSASYLSEIMPNTFSMAPRYVRDYVARTEFRSPRRDLFVSLDQKLRRLYRQATPATTGSRSWAMHATLASGLERVSGRVACRIGHASS